MEVLAGPIQQGSQHSPTAEEARFPGGQGVGAPCSLLSMGPARQPWDSVVHKGLVQTSEEGMNLQEGTQAWPRGCNLGRKSC